jgi:hypothetical protein
VGFWKVSPPYALREGAYFHDLPGSDPPSHNDLHAERIIGFHDGSNRCSGRNLNVKIVVVTNDTISSSGIRK